MYKRYNFHAYYEERMRFVRYCQEENFETRDIKDGQVTFVEVPIGFGDISSGRRVFLSKQGNALTILFFLSHGFLDGFSGYLFIADNRKPGQKEFGYELDQSVKIEDHWYYVGSP